jgi:hypothetical protein
MDDRTLLARFEDCTLPREVWSHRAHLRVAYLYLRSHPFETALGKMRQGVQRYNAATGVPDKPHRGYHETLTQAWMRVVASTMKHHGVGKDSEDFCNTQSHLLNRQLLRLFYTRHRIMSPEAKRTFVQPDITPLPEPEDK